MMLPKTTINPTGNSTEEKLERLIQQLRLQNEEYKRIIFDLYREIENRKKG